MRGSMSEEQIYEEARKRVKAKKEFWGHLGTWAMVNIILIIIWALTGSRDNLWFLWPLCIWGAVVLFQYLRTFVFEQRSDRTAIEKEIDKIKKEQN